MTPGDGEAKPRLVFFFAPSSGTCRRTEGHLAQALQRRHNHDTFRLVRVNVEERPDLAQRLRVDEVPTLVVVDGRRVARRIVSPRGCRELERELAEWLR
ncbi:MAG TPA: thioredoxin family protein [Gaiellaceae bacterium]|nr:thioredoxin family protein [Gaiellaceae bacterium]